MHFIVRFHDNPGMEHRRQQHMQDHLAFLERHGRAVIGAGPLFSGDAGDGGLWLVDAETPEEVEAMVRADPLFASGLRRSWDIQEWRQVMRDGQRLI